MHSTKYLLISLGLVLLVFSSIKFYNQPLPPNSGSMLEIYDYLHGNEYKNESTENNKVDEEWYNQRYNYNASEINGEYFYILEYFEFTDKETVFHFRIKCNEPSTPRVGKELATDKDKTDTKSFFSSDPFPHPVIRKKFSDGYSPNNYPVLYRETEIDSSNTMIINLHFPLISRSKGNIVFWEDYYDNASEYSKLFLLSNHRGPSPSISRPKGTTIWGILVVVGMVISFIGTVIRYNPIARLRKQLLKEIEILDEKRDKILGRISKSDSFLFSSNKDLKDLSDREKNRYEAAISYFEQAQNTILNSYKYLSFGINKSFEKFYQITLGLGLVLLFAILIITSFKLVYTESPDFAPVAVQGGSGSVDSAFIESRILNLETAKSSLPLLLIVLSIFGVTSILLNYLFGVWKVRQVARSEIGLRFIRYDNKLIDQLGSKTEVFEQKISEVENRLNDMKLKLNSKIHESELLSSSTKSDLGYIYNQEIKDIERESKKSVRKMKSEFKKIIKERLKPKGNLVFKCFVLFFLGSSISIFSSQLIQADIGEPVPVGTVGTVDIAPPIEMGGEIYADFERRLAVLESAKQDMKIWITIFVATVTLLTGLNIGLSVLQVGSIARREVENSIKEYDEKFDGFLTGGTETINKKLADYDSRLETIKEKTSELNLNVEKSIDLIDERINAFRKDADNILDKFRTESQNVKLSVLNELQTYHSKQMQILMEKEKKQDTESA